MLRREPGSSGVETGLQSAKPKRSSRSSVYWRWLCARGALAVNLDAEEERGGPKVAQLEALSEQALDLGDLLLRLGCERDVVDEDGHNDLHAVLLPDEHQRVGADASEAQLDKYFLEAAEPLAAALLEAVEALEQAGDPGGIALSKAVGLLHVDVDVVQLAVEVGVADVDRLQLEVLERGEREDGAESVGANVSSKSTPGRWPKPFATRRAL
jgi:hypothetical protein